MTTVPASATAMATTLARRMRSPSTKRSISATHSGLVATSTTELATLV